MTSMDKAKIFHSNNLPEQARKIAKAAWLSNETRDKVLGRYQGFFRALVEREFDICEGSEA